MTHDSRLPQPFLRWPGGKSWLVRAAGHLLPARPRRYIEPFLGSGALFFALRPTSAILSDANAELIRTYESVRDHATEVLQLLKSMEASAECYYETRDSVPMTPVDAAARFLYLNRLGFSGIYRVNRKGEFNVPYGGDRKLAFFWNNDRLIRASTALKRATLLVGDFGAVMAATRRGDLVYCDPVYLVGSGSDPFRRYTSPPFDESDQSRLVTAIGTAVDRGATVLLSWPAALELPELDGRFATRHMLERRSTISARAKQASVIQEYLVIFLPNQT